MAGHAILLLTVFPVLPCAHVLLYTQHCTLRCGVIALVVTLALAAASVTGVMLAARSEEALRRAAAEGGIGSAVARLQNKLAWLACVKACDFATTMRNLTAGRDLFCWLVALSVSRESWPWFEPSSGDVA